MATTAPQIQTARKNLEGLRQTLGNIQTATVLLDRLEATIQSSRAQRSPTVRVVSTTIRTTVTPSNEGVVVQATAKTGDFSQYDTRISFHPKQGVHCNCPDLKQRRTACKHIAALAVVCRKRFWAISDLLEKEAGELSVKLGIIEEGVASLLAQIDSKESEAAKLNDEIQAGLESSMKVLES